MNTLLRFRSMWRVGVLGALLVLLLGLFTLRPTLTTQAQGGEQQEFQTDQSSISPRIPGPDDQLVSDLTRKQLRKLQRKYLRSREQVASQVVAEEGPPSSAESAVEATGGNMTDASVAEAVSAPGDLTIASNNVNNVVHSAGQFRTFLAEPAVGNVGKNVFYTGNTFASYSSNEGVAWTQRAFPSAAIAGETVCCDQDIEVDQGRDRVFWGLLYLNATGTHGTVTIAVMTSPTSAPSCLYDIDLGTNRVPDYPHLGLSNDFLYLNTNRIDTKGTSSTTDDTWVNSEMRRFGLDEMVSCTTTPTSVYTYGPPTFTSQRVFVPVEGATDSMYWGVLDNTTTFRIFTWPETSASVSSTTRAIATSPHNNPDCRGGTNNTDYIERPTAYSITGFRMRGWYGAKPKGGTQDVIGFLWNVGTDGSHTQAHIHAAVFDADTKNLVSQPHIWSASYCFAFPDVAPTGRGHPAIVLAYGGQSGGGGIGIRNAVLLGDDRATGAGPFGDFVTVATGTHNPPSTGANANRYGDYLTIQQHEPCSNFMVASPYVLNGGTAAANVQMRYTQFGRGRDLNCWSKWHNQP